MVKLTKSARRSAARAPQGLPVRLLDSNMMDLAVRGVREVGPNPKLISTSTARALSLQTTRHLERTSRA